MGGYQQLDRGEAMRGKFRNRFEKPQTFCDDLNGRFTNSGR